MLDCVCLSCVGFGRLNVLHGPMPGILCLLCGDKRLLFSMINMRLGSYEKLIPAGQYKREPNECVQYSRFGT